ncbi:MAG TPA: tetratricopeptide repeat protein [Polyangiaceae bacterium]
MDCERFDRVVLDLLYDELDELTAAAARRHTDGCARCRGILSGLRATREVGTLPLVDPPEGLELKILEAERHGRERLPFRQRAGRAVSVLAGYAMRPQLAMAAILLLAIGGSLVFLRARPGDRDNMSVTERGVAQADPESVAVLPATAASALPDRAADAHGTLGDEVAAGGPRRLSARSRPPAAAAPVAEQTAEATGEGDSAFQSGLAALQNGRYKEARQQFEGVAARGGPEAADAALHAARAAKGEEGCSAAAALFDQVPTRYPSTKAGYDATLEAAACYETLGDTEKARRTYQALLDVPSHGDRAKAGLAQLDRIDPPVQVAARKAKAAASPPPVDAKAAAKPGAGDMNAEPPQQAAPPPSNVGETRQ